MTCTPTRGRTSGSGTFQAEPMLWPMLGTR